MNIGIKNKIELNVTADKTAKGYSHAEKQFGSFSLIKAYTFI